MAVLDAFQPLDASIRTKQFGVVSRRTLAEMALVRSDNTAASILCEEYPTGYSGCIAAMNAKAAELQMTSTSFSDATGLNKTNVSTADDLVKLVAAASTYPLIVAASDMNHVKMKTRNKWFVMNNTNPLVGQGHGIIVSKTGFINLSGGCIVMMMNTARGIRTVILLGSKNTKTRIPEAATLASLY